MSFAKYIGMYRKRYIRIYMIFLYRSFPICCKIAYLFAHRQAFWAWCTIWIRYNDRFSTNQAAQAREASLEQYNESPNNVINGNYVKIKIYVFGGSHVIQAIEIILLSSQNTELILSSIAMKEKINSILLRKHDRFCVFFFSNKPTVINTTILIIPVGSHESPKILPLALLTNHTYDISNSQCTSK